MIRVVCPAKLNLFLAVGPPDGRGYHPLRTVFQAISLCDELTIGREPIGGEAAVTHRIGSHVVACNWDGLPANNTVAKALRLFSEIAQVPPLHLRLEKKVPAESGLGGGSSDAAGVIRAINHFLPSPIADHHLFDVAVSVGMDVPFFLVGGRARGEGYGERLTPLPDPETAWYVVVRPQVGVSTKDAYARLDESPRPFKEFSEPVEPYNDFERVMPCDCEDWSERLLVHGAQTALLSGSGSAVFGSFVDERAASQAADALRVEWVNSYGSVENIPVWVTRSLSREESLRVERL